MSKFVLVIDDSESVRELVALTIESAGYKVLKAIDGQDALRFFNDYDINLVLTDLHMPNVDGIQLTKDIRNLNSHRTTPIIVITTELSALKKEEAKLAGATAWIIKPFNQQKLLDIVKRIIGNPN